MGVVDDSSKHPIWVFQKINLNTLHSEHYQTTPYNMIKHPMYNIKKHHTYKIIIKNNIAIAIYTI